jgi:hypothetical protein
MVLTTKTVPRSFCRSRRALIDAAVALGVRRAVHLGLGFNSDIRFVDAALDGACVLQRLKNKANPIVLCA